MKSNICVIVIGLCSACSQVPQEPEPASTPMVDAGLGRNANAVTSSPPPTPVADHVVEPEITVVDAENETEYPMLGHFTGFGRFPAEATIRVSEPRQGAARAALMVAGESARHGRIGLTLGLTPAQGHLLAQGARLEFDETSAVSYGPASSPVSRIIHAVRVSRNEVGVTTIVFELGDEIDPAGEVQTDSGGTGRLVLIGDFDISCTVPGPEGSRWQALHDPRLETEFCQQLLAKFGLKNLVAQQ